jgi:tetratricopeptide (TPR) repeat protein
MLNKNNFGVFRIILAGLVAAGLACAASGQNSGGGAGSGSGGGAGASSNNSGKDIGRDTSLTNPAVALELVRPPEKKEEKAYKAYKTFAAIPNTDSAKKLGAGEGFVKDYPNSQYVKYVYPYVVVAYVQNGQMDKALAAGQKDLEANPQDVRTMAVLSQSLARAYDASAPNAADHLAKAEDYGKKALAGVETVTKPEGVADENFEKMKTDTKAMAHSGVGLVLLRENKFEEAIPDLEKATSLDTNDQTNFYLLAVANLNAQHNLEAAAAFKKCAALAGNLQATCASSATDAESRAGKK